MNISVKSYEKILENLKMEIQFLQYQIGEAKKARVTEFDSKIYKQHMKYKFVKRIK